MFVVCSTVGPFVVCHAQHTEFNSRGSLFLNIIIILNFLLDVNYVGEVSGLARNIKLIKKKFSVCITVGEENFTVDTIYNMQYLIL